MLFFFFQNQSVDCLFACVSLSVLVESRFFFSFYSVCLEIVKFNLLFTSVY